MSQFEIKRKNIQKEVSALKIAGFALVAPLLISCGVIGNSNSNSGSELSSVGGKAQAVQTDACKSKKIHFDSKHGRKWVKIRQCDKSDKQKIQLEMSDSYSGPFYRISDTGGHGQDHCELVKPGFTLPNSDNIKSACPECDIGKNIVTSSIPKVAGTFVRSGLGEKFTFVEKKNLDNWGTQTTDFYDCGIDFAKIQSRSYLPPSVCTGPSRIVTVQIGQKVQFVKAVRCDAKDDQKIDLLMSDKANGEYHKLSDTAGHGQDHCELIKPGFKLPNPDNIQSACPECEIGSNVVTSTLRGVKGTYVRSGLGQSFVFSPASQLDNWGTQTTKSYDCGIAFASIPHTMIKPSVCHGASKTIIRKDSAGAKRFVRVVRCDAKDPQKIDLLMSESVDGPFHKISDTAGHGQDHCELVKPGFKLPNSDNIQSACKDCEIGTNVVTSTLPGVKGTFVRSNLGEPFTYVPKAKLDSWETQTTPMYDCGINLWSPVALTSGSPASSAPTPVASSAPVPVPSMAPTIGN